MAEKNRESRDRKKKGGVPGNDNRQDNHALLKSIMDTSDVVIVCFNIQTGQYDYMSPACEALFGYTPDEYANIGPESALAMIHPDDFPVFEAALKAVEVTGTAKTEYRQRIKDGRWVWVSNYMSVIRDEFDQPLCIVSNSRDITERKQAEEALKESEKRFRTLFEGHQDIMLIIEPESGNIIDANPAAAAFYGYSREALRKMNIQEINQSPADEVKEQRMKAALNNQTRFIFPHRLANGQVRTVEAHASPVIIAQQPVLFSIIHDVTDRKRAEEALKKSEEEYRLLFSSIDEGFCVVEVLFDDNGKAVDYRFLEMNPAFEEQTGLHDATSKRMKKLEPLHEAHWFETYGRIALTGKPERFTNEAKYLGGRWYDVYAFRVGQSEEHKVAILFRDITERRKTEAALRESEERFRSVVANLSEGLMLFDDKMNLIYQNPASLRIHHAAVDEGPVLPAVWQILDDHGRPVGFDEWPVSRVFRGESFQNMVLHLRLQDGGVEFDASYNGSPIYDAAGKLVLGFITIRDITERKKAMEDLAYQATFPQLNPNPIVELDSDGGINYMNPAAVKLFPGLNISHPYLAGWHALTEEISPEETGSRTKDIKVDDAWYEQVISGVPSSRYFRIYGSDITERKRADQLKDEFIGMVSHEIKTPLTVIIGALSTANLENLPRDQVKGFLDDALIYSDILADIVDNLLELSRAQSDRLTLDKSPVNIGEIAARVIRMQARRAHGHNLINDVPADLPAVTIDRTRAERVMHNLVDNAIKYSPRGGDIRIFAELKNGGLLVGVSDQGIGISPEDQARLFQRFERLDLNTGKAIQGIGLGLNVCRILVEAHGGKIWVESEPGQGSTFYFTLPLEGTAE